VLLGDLLATGRAGCKGKLFAGDLLYIPGLSAMRQTGISPLI